MTAAETARVLRLRPVPMRQEWRGDCPACGYAAAFVLSERGGRPLWWCAACQDGRAIAAALRTRGALPAHAASKPLRRAKPQADRNTPNALAAYAEAAPAAGTIVRCYLAARDLELPAAAPIRCLQACWHPGGPLLPAMVALVTTAAGEPVAIHRTYLAPDGSGKAAVEPAKATLGPFHGNAVVLHPPGPEIVVGEGIETALSASEIFGLPRSRP